MPTAPQASALTAHRVGGQLDESIVVPAGYEYADLIIVATLTGANSQDVIDPTNLATVLDGPYTTVVGGTQGTDTTEPSPDGETTLAGRYWWTEPLKATTAADPDNALQPTGLGWTISLQIKGRTANIELRSYSITLDADRDYAGQNPTEVLTLDTTSTGGQVADQVVNVAHLLPPPTTVPVSDAFTDRVTEALADIPLGALEIAKLDTDIATQAELDNHNHDGTYSTVGHTHVVPKHMFLSLRDGDGSTADAIQAAFDAGEFAIGDAIQTVGYHPNSQFGGCVYRVVAGGTGTDDGGSYLDFTGFQLEAVTDRSPDVTQFGAVGDGATDDTAALAAAVAYAETNSMTAWFPPGSYRTTSEITVNAPARIDMDPNAEIHSDHDGVAVRLVGNFQSPFVWNISVRKMAGTEWWRATSTDTTSVGIQLENHAMQTYAFRALDFGAVGVYLAGAADNGAITSCTFLTPFLNDNFVNLKADSVSGSNTGFANEIKYYGGKLSYSSNARDTLGNPHPGTRSIWLGPRNNGHVFFGINLEGDACERIIYCEGFYNAWYHARLEYSSPIEFVAPNGYHNLIHYGTFFNGVDDIRDDANPEIIDPNRWNSYKSVWGDTNWSAQIDGDGRAMRYTTDVAAATYNALEVARGQTTGDDSTGEVRLVLTHDGRLGQIDTGGTMRYLQQPTGAGPAAWV